MNGAGPNSVSAGQAGWLLVQRDLRLALRRPGEWLQPLVFFLVVTTLFPLATDPQLSRLRDIAPGALWVAALLSCLLALELLFREDVRTALSNNWQSLGCPCRGYFWPNAVCTGC